MRSASIASQPCSCRSSHGDRDESPRRRGEHGEFQTNRRVSPGLRATIPAHACTVARTRSAGTAAGRFREPGRAGRADPQAHRGRARAGALAGPGAIWGRQADRAGRRPRRLGHGPQDRPGGGGALRAVARADRPAPARRTRVARRHGSSTRTRPHRSSSPSPAATSSSPRPPPRARRSVTTRRC